MAELRVFTREELKTYDGKDGRPVYVAYKGRVYDVSASKMWKSGTHMRKHAAGQDLTAELAGAPHNEEVFDRVPLVGTLAAAPREAEAGGGPFEHLPRPLAALLESVPFLQRHPHPMTVHFPIVFMMTAPVFALLYLATGVEGFELASLYTLVAGVFFDVVAIVTGLLTWWINYLARPVRPIVIKLVTALVMLALSAAACAWRLSDPGVLSEASPSRAVYLAALILLFPLVSIVGWYGASLTFPLEKRRDARQG
jgi:predicted heme/steroid binding protein/uncharacterized membrane protein